MRVRIIGLLALLAVGLAVAGAAQAQAPPPGKALRKLQVAYLKSLSFSPLFLAIDKGYLADEGIQADLKIVQSVSEVIAFLGRGQIDIAFGNIAIPLFNAVGRGVDVRVIGGVSYAPAAASAPSPNPIILRKALAQTGAIKSVADLKGRRIALNTRGGIIEYQFATALRQVGLSIGNIEIALIGFPDTLAALTNGAVDAAILPEPLATAAQQRDIAAVLVPNPVAGLLITVLMAGSSLLSDGEAATLEALLRGLRRAANELQSPEAIMSTANLAIWAKYTDIPAATIARTVPYVFARDLALDAASLARQQKYLLESGQISAEQPLDKLVAQRFAK